MADVQINKEIRYSRYGRIYFNWTAMGDDHIVNNRVDDSLNVRVGGYERHPWDYNNNDLVTTRREGRERISTVQFRVKRSDLMGADELYLRILAGAAGTGVVPPFTVSIELLDANGTSTGELLVFPDSVFAEGSAEFNESGGNWDEMPVSIECPHGDITPTAVA